jgi:hypothetical protein
VGDEAGRPVSTDISTDSSTDSSTDAPITAPMMASPEVPVPAHLGGGVGSVGGAQVKPGAFSCVESSQQWPVRALPSSRFRGKNEQAWHR